VDALLVAVFGATGVFPHANANVNVSEASSETWSLRTMNPPALARGKAVKSAMVLETRRRTSFTLLNLKSL
jgi:hypothetical protein